MSSRLLAFNSNDGHYEPLVLENGTQHLFVTSPLYNDMLVDLDQIESACNQIKDNTDQIEGRLYDTASGQNAGESLKLIETDIEATNTLLTAQKSVLDDMLVDTDTCVSKLTDISSNASLTASRCSNLQDWIGTSDGAGGGVKTGVNIASLAGCVSGTELQVDVVSGSVSISGGATEAKQDTMETSLNAIETLITSSNTKLDTLETTANAVETLITSSNTKLDTLETTANALETLLTTQATHNTNLLTKNTEVDTAVDEVVDNTSYLDPTANKKSATAIYTTATTITDTNFINSGTAIDTQGYSAIRFYGEATSNNAFHCQVSDDNTNFFPSMTLTIYPSQVQGSTLYYFDTLYNSPPRYIKLKNDSGGSITFNHLRYTLFP